MDEHIEAALMRAGAQINALQANERRLIDELSALRAMLSKARAGLSNGLWDYGPGQDEHEQCNELLAEIDKVLVITRR